MFCKLNLSVKIDSTFLENNLAVLIRNLKKRFSICNTLLETSPKGIIWIINMILWKKVHCSIIYTSNKVKSRDITLPTKVCILKAMFFPVVMNGCESWNIKKAECQRTDVFKRWCWRRLLKNPLDSKEIKLISPKGSQPWIFIGRTDAEAEVSILWPRDRKSWLTGKDPDAGKDWRGEGSDRGWDGWMASSIQWTWVWVNSGK